MYDKMNEEALLFLKSWMVERESIRLKKEASEHAPWTVDPILRNYRFTNVRREDDKISRWIIDNLINNDRSIKERVADVLVARMHNQYDMMVKFLPFGYWGTDFNFSNLDTEMELWKKKTKTPYLGNAFKMGGFPYVGGYFAEKEGESNGLTPSRKPALLRAANWFRLVNEWYSDGTLDAIISFDDELELQKYMFTLVGMGEFMGYQHFVDMTYIPELGMSENVFTICGPGAQVGMKLLWSEEIVDCRWTSTDKKEISYDWQGMSENDLLLQMTKDFDIWFPEWPYDWKPTVMCLENVMCETQKYIYTNMGLGKPKNKYDGEAKSVSLESFFI